MEQPEIAGELRLENGEIKIKDIPQKFTALNGTLTFNQNRIVIDSLTGEVRRRHHEADQAGCSLAVSLPGFFSTRIHLTT